MKKFKAIVNEVIAKEARSEAIAIMEMSEDAKAEFMKYYGKDQFNICCMALDKWKDKLVAAGKMVRCDGDHFGNWF